MSFGTPAIVPLLPQPRLRAAVGARGCGFGAGQAGSTVGGVAGRTGGVGSVALTLYLEVVTVLVVWAAGAHRSKRSKRRRVGNDRCRASDAGVVGAADGLAARPPAGRGGPQGRRGPAGPAGQQRRAQ